MRRRSATRHRRFVPIGLTRARWDVRQMSQAARGRVMNLRQHVRYVTAPDGNRLAWAEAGAGPVVVKAANWLTHLEYEWSSPVWKHWLQFFSGAYRFVRYDERGCGMSDWTPGSAPHARPVGVGPGVGRRGGPTGGTGHAARASRRARPPASTTRFAIRNGWPG